MKNQHVKELAKRILASTLTESYMVAIEKISNELFAIYDAADRERLQAVRQMRQDCAAAVDSMVSPIRFGAKNAKVSAELNSRAVCEKILSVPIPVALKDI